jgi:DnaD/phage-associated family protein
MTISTLNSMDQISQILFSGHVDPNLIKEAKKIMIDANKSNAKYLKKVISSKIIKENGKN